MNRKAIQLANNTLVVSLPAKWARSNKIVKGSELNVEERGESLTLNRAGTGRTEGTKIKIDISGMNVTLVWNYLNAVYRSGFDEIEIFFSESLIRDIKKCNNRKTIELIANIVDKLAGMEIIRQTKNTCVIKEITQMDSEAYNNVLNRIHLSLITIAQDLLVAVKNKDTATLETLHQYSEVNINKLSDYCLRLLNLANPDNQIESNTNYLITFLLEEIGDTYAEIARTILATGKPICSSTVQLIADTNDLFEFSYKIFQKPGKAKLIEFHERRNALKKKLQAMSAKEPTQMHTMFLMGNALDKMMEINNCITTASVK